MNQIIQPKSYELWQQFHYLIQNELNSEKNKRDQNSFFIFLDNEIEKVKSFANFLQNSTKNDENNRLYPEAQRLNELATKLNHLRASMHHPFVLYVMGMGKVGKSSLLNLLVGSKVADVDVLPKTWKTDFFYASDTEIDVTVNYRNGDVKKISRLEAKKLILDEEEKREDSEDEIEKEFRKLSKELKSIEDKTELKQELMEKLLYQSDIKEIQWGLTNFPETSILHQFSIVDTPGLWQHHNGTHGENVGDFYHQADGILWLLDSTTLSAGKPKEVLEQLSTSLNYVGQKSKNMLAVLGKIDKVRKEGGEERVAQVVDSAKKIFSDYFLDVLPCSAKEALDAQKVQDDLLLKQSGYPELLNTIQKFFYDNALSLRIEGKSNNFVGILQTHIQESGDFLIKIQEDAVIYDQYKQQISEDLMKMKDKFQQDWKSKLSQYAQKVRNNIQNKASTYTSIEEESVKNDYVKKEILIITELESLLVSFQKEKILEIEKYIKQQQKKIGKSFERYHFIQNLKPALFVEKHDKNTGYTNTSVDLSSAETEGLFIGGAAAGLAMLALGPIGLLAGAIGFFWSQSRKVDKAKEAFEKQLSSITQDTTNSITKFIDNLFKRNTDSLNNYLMQQFEHIYLPRNNVVQVLDIYTQLENMKNSKFTQVTFQDFILGAQ